VKFGDLILDEDGDYGIVMETIEVRHGESMARILFPSTVAGDTMIEYAMNEWQIVKVFGQ
jgi:hypothetical protein